MQHKQCPHRKRGTVFMGRMSTGRADPIEPQRTQRAQRLLAGSIQQEPATRCKRTTPQGGRARPRARVGLSFHETAIETRPTTFRVHGARLAMARLCVLRALCGSNPGSSPSHPRRRNSLGKSGTFSKWRISTSFGPGPVTTSTTSKRIVRGLVRSCRI